MNYPNAKRAQNALGRALAHHRWGEDVIISTLDLLWRGSRRPPKVGSDEWTKWWDKARWAVVAAVLEVRQAIGVHNDDVKVVGSLLTYKDHLLRFDQERQAREAEEVRRQAAKEVPDGTSTL
jgi:hypothetical protein